MRDCIVDETSLAVKAFKKVMTQANCTINTITPIMVRLLIKVFLTRSIVRPRRLLFAPLALITRMASLKTKTRC